MAELPPANGLPPTGSSLCVECRSPQLKSALFCSSCGAPMESEPRSPSVGGALPTVSSAPAMSIRVDPVPPMAGPSSPRFNRSRGPTFPVVGLLALVGIASFLVFRDTGPTEAQKKAAVAARVDDAAARQCEGSLASLASSLDTIHEALSTSEGINHSDYGTKIDETKAAYESVDTTTITSQCHDQVREPMRLALNEYVDAYNVWGTCINDYYCAISSIDSKRQADWSSATKHISTGEENTTAWVNTAASTLVEAEKALKD